MRFKVPKDIDIEDRIVGPLTAKQLLWLGIGAGLCVLWWQFADFALFMLLAVMTMGISAAFAFLKPYNQTLIGFAGSLLMFTTKPKQYLWRKVGVIFSRKSSRKKKELVPLTKKGFPEENVKELAKVVDKEGGK